MVEKVDPATGERWRKVPRLHEQLWFVLLIASVWIGLAWFLWWSVSHALPELLLTPASQRLWAMGQSLALGQGFSLPGMDGHWWPMVSIPPIFPLILALMMLANGGSTDPSLITPWVQWMDLGLMIVATWLLLRLTTPYFKYPYPAIICGLFTLSPLAWQSLAEGSQFLLFQVFSLGALVSLDSAFKDASAGKLPNGKTQFFIGCWLLLAVGTHVAGWALVLAWLGLIVRWMGPRQLLAVLAISILALSPWWVRTLYVETLYERQHPGYTRMLSAVNDARLEPTTRSKPLMQRLNRWAGGATLSLLGVTEDPSLTQRGVLPAHQHSGLRAFVQSAADTVQALLLRYPWIHWALGALVAWGAMLLLAKRSGVVGAYVALWAVVSVFLLPLAVQHSAAVAFPAILLCWFTALKALGDWLQPARIPLFQYVAPLLVTAMILSSLLQYLGLLYRGGDWLATNPATHGLIALQALPGTLSTALPPVWQKAPDSIGPDAPAPRWPLPFAKKTPPAPVVAATPVATSPPAVERVTAKTTVTPPVPQAPVPASKPTSSGYQLWLSQNTRLSDTLIHHDPATLHEMTQRPVYDLPTGGRPAALLTLFNKGNFLVEDTRQPESGKVVAPLLKEYPNRFRLAYRAENDPVRVWQILPSSRSASSLVETATAAPIPTSRPPERIATTKPPVTPGVTGAAAPIPRQKPTSTFDPYNRRNPKSSQPPQGEF